MKLDKWIEIIEEQKRKYYAKPIPYVPPSVSNNKSTNENPFEKYAKNDGGRNRNGFEKLEATNQLKTKRGFSKIK